MLKLFPLVGDTHVPKEDQGDKNDKDDEDDNENKTEEEEREEDKEAKKVMPLLTVSVGSLSDLEELLFCRSQNQIKETVREYQAANSSDLTETIRMEFSELKAEAFCSLGGN